MLLFYTSTAGYKMVQLLSGRPISVSLLLFVALATLLPSTIALAGWSNGRSLFQNGPAGLGVACQDCHSLSALVSAANNPSLIANKIQFIQQMNIFSGRFS
ncbi:MAG: hypothetical protein HY066_06510 [Betaproteobacteria bacterium]|nr:hypothetical protein [Betaproteobacteria bacterium]